ncbi:MAG: DNA damage-inducible protein 1, partial [Tremellales sp. Tagirdzhanova-0007]
MRLTIIAPDAVYEHEVDPSIEVQDVQALIEAENGLPASSQLLSDDSGAPLSDKHKSLESFGVKGDACTIFLTFSDVQPTAGPSSGYPQQPRSQGFPNTDADLERMRLQALGDPNLMSDLRN